MILLCLAWAGCAPGAKPSAQGTSALPTSTLTLGPIPDIEKAKQAALTFSGLSKLFVSFAKEEADEKKDGGTVYKLEYATLTATYRMRIQADDGRILEYDVDGTMGGGGKNAKAAQDTLSRMVPGFTVDGTSLELDTSNDDGNAVYEGVVNVNGVEYKVEIHAATGQLLQWTPE